MSAKRKPDETRAQLLGAAFSEIHRNGFRSASLERILSDTGVTKGALYHHFGSKQELGYAVVEEVLAPRMAESMWGPLVDTDDPVSAAVGMIQAQLDNPPRDIIENGCPFNNLVQEMAGIDEGFRERLNLILDQWRGVISEALMRGQAHGTVRDDIDTEAVAAFIISCFEGLIGMAKAAQRADLLGSGMQGLQHYLETLRPAEPRSRNEFQSFAAISRSDAEEQKP